MTVLQPDRAVQMIRESICPSSEKSASKVREPRRAVNDQTTTATDIHDRSVQEVNNDKTTTITYQEYLRREAERKKTPQDRLLEYEVQEQMTNDNLKEQLARYPASVLRQAADLSEARERGAGKPSGNNSEVTEAELDKLSAQAFGREVKETDTTDNGAPTEADLDKLSATAFGRTSA